MNGNTREKWANRTAYAILALLLIAALTVTVIAIVSTVNQRKEPLPNEGEPSGEGEQNGEAQPPEQNGEQNPPAETPPEDTPPEQPPEDEKKPEAQVFVLPANGYVMREYT